MSAFGSPTSSDNYAVRCVFWNTMRFAGDWSWRSRARVHDAVIQGICEGTKLSECKVTAAVFSWKPDSGQRRMLASIRRLTCQTKAS